MNHDQITRYAYALQQRDEARRARTNLVSQVEKSNAVDDHGHIILKLKALADAHRRLAHTE